jgi:hypothetical protein
VNPRITNVATSAVCAFALLGASACRSLHDKAVEQFGADYSCPADRVQARERSDIHATTLFVDPPAPVMPPDEVRNDPARLAVWQANQQQAQSTQSSYLDFMTVFEVTGCDHRAFYACARAARVNGFNDARHCMSASHVPLQ